MYMNILLLARAPHINYKSYPSEINRRGEPDRWDPNLDPSAWTSAELKLGS